MEDGQINELGSTYSNLEGQGQVHKKPQKEHHTFDVLSNKTHKFQAILQLLHLVTTLQNRRDKHSNQIHDINGTRKAFNYVDAITNLMVRDNEIVAAVALADANPPSSIISVSSESENVQPRPALEDPELSSDFYDESTLSESFLQVAAVTNSKFYKNVKFELGHHENYEILCSSDSKILGRWEELKQCEEEDLALWGWNLDSTLEGHMIIIQSYLNEYKHPDSNTDYRRTISNKMLKYIIGSCLKKMHRRAFYWTSLSMIGYLTWKKSSNDNIFPDIDGIFADPDHKLIEHLRIVLQDNQTTFAQSLMTYHPFRHGPSLADRWDPNYLDDFMTLASGTSPYEFDRGIASIFLDVLLSSLYAYLCTMAQLKRVMTMSEKDYEEIRKYTGRFTNAVRTLYLVSHSNAMKTYFNNAKISSQSHRERIYVSTTEIRLKKLYELQGWVYDLNLPTTDDGGEPENDEGEEDQNLPGLSLKPDIGTLYRRSFMSLVDHKAGLRLLERRSIGLPSNELIKLSLIAVKHPLTGRYLPWKEMKKAIVETCKLSPSVDGSVDDGSVMIEKIEAHLKKNDIVGPIRSFRKLVEIDKNQELRVNSQYPEFKTCVHCEASLAVFLGELHSTPDNPLLHEHFQISNKEGKKYTYHLSVSKFCCPVCWELIDAVNSIYCKFNVEFVVRARHSNLYPVHLPPSLPDGALDMMIDRFKQMLHDALNRLPDANVIPSFVPGHNNLNPSLESAGESVSSVGTTDRKQVVKDAGESVIDFPRPTICSKTEDDHI